MAQNVATINTGSPATWGRYKPTSLYDQYTALEAKATAANKARESEIRDIYGEVIRRYQPGGAFQKSGLNEIETQKTTDVGKYTQSLVDSGMFGTTTMANAPMKWEKEIGSGKRLALEDIMMQRLTSAQTGMADFVERIQNSYPDTGQMGSLFQGASGGGGYGGSGVPGGSAGGGSGGWWEDSSFGTGPGGGTTDLLQGTKYNYTPYQRPSGSVGAAGTAIATGSSPAEGTTGTKGGPVSEMFGPRTSETSGVAAQETVNIQSLAQWQQANPNTANAAAGYKTYLTMLARGHRGANIATQKAAARMVQAMVSGTKPAATRYPTSSTGWGGEASKF